MKNNRFQTTSITNPGDIFYIMSYEGLLSNSLSIRLEGHDSLRPTKYIEYFSLPNVDKSWELLKSLNEMGARKVIREFHKNDDSIEYQEFENTPAYYCRFGKPDEKYAHIYYDNSYFHSHNIKLPC